MKKIIQVFILIFVSSFAHAQIKDEGPVAYFGYLGLDSLKRTDLIKYDTLRMNNPNLKITRFYVAISTLDCESCIDDVSFIEIEGNRLSNNKEFYRSLKMPQRYKSLLTIMDVEFINSKGKLIKYPKPFHFKLY